MFVGTRNVRWLVDIGCYKKETNARWANELKRTSRKVNLAGWWNQAHQPLLVKELTESIEHNLERSVQLFIGIIIASGNRIPQCRDLVRTKDFGAVTGFAN